MIKPIFALFALLALTACGSTSEYADGAFARPRVTGSGGVQCVPFVRDKTGVQIYGDAHTWWGKARGLYDREEEPERGSVLVLRGYKRTDRGHVAVVRRVVSEREIVIDHANWLNDGRIYLDQPVKDVSADNDWSQVRVWYAPGNQYGARIYDVEGFILPGGRSVADAKDDGY